MAWLPGKQTIYLTQKPPYAYSVTNLVNKKQQGKPSLFSLLNKPIVRFHRKNYRET